MKKEIVKGYKGFDNDLKCRDFQYEIGKTYTMGDDIVLCRQGFHFCRDFKNVNNFYNFVNDNYRFCEIEALGKVVDEDDNSKSVTNKIKIVREIPREKMLTMLNFGKNNIGFFNTGDRNTGDWNKTNRSSGVLCNKEPKIMLFNKETDITFGEWRNSRAYKVWWDNLDKINKKTLFELPNFDLEVFNDILELEITEKEYKKIMK